MRKGRWRKYITLAKVGLVNRSPDDLDASEPRLLIFNQARTYSPDKANAPAVSIQEVADRPALRSNTVPREINHGHVAAVHIGRVLHSRVGAHC